MLFFADALRFLRVYEKVPSSVAPISLAIASTFLSTNREHEPGNKSWRRLTVILSYAYVTIKIRLG
jgi:hypothetical protein